MAITHDSPGTAISLKCAPPSPVLSNAKGSEQASCQQHDRQQIDGAQVEREARRIICSQPHLRGRAATIHVECQDGKLLLTGQLPSFYLKQVLQEALRSIEGVTEVHNGIDVTRTVGVQGQRRG